MNWMLREGANEQFVGSRGVSLVKKVSELDLIVADNHYWTMIGSSIWTHLFVIVVHFMMGYPWVIANWCMTLWCILVHLSLLRRQFRRIGTETNDALTNGGSQMDQTGFSTGWIPESSAVPASSWSCEGLIIPCLAPVFRRRFGQLIGQLHEIVAAEVVGLANWRPFREKSVSLLLHGYGRPKNDPGLGIIVPSDWRYTFCFRINNDGGSTNAHIITNHLRFRI